MKEGKSVLLKDKIMVFPQRGTKIKIYSNRYQPDKGNFNEDDLLFNKNFID